MPANAQRIPETSSAARAESGVRDAAAAFVKAFNAMDEAAFNALWAEDASVFFPQHPFPIRRVEGKAEVTKWFKRFMDSQRAGGKSPGVQPTELAIRMLGKDGALVSFHLSPSDDKAAARRTLVYRRDKNGWKIVHLHASQIAVPKP